MEFNGLPLHPLVVHAVVVFAPLAAMFGVGYAALSRWRWALRWPLVAVTAVAVVSAVVAALSGEDLAIGGGSQVPQALQEHQDRGELLRNILLGFTVVVGLAAWRLGGPSGLRSGRGERPCPGGPLYVAVLGLLVVGSLGVGVAAFLAGDSGARAVWGGGS